MSRPLNRMQRLIAAQVLAEEKSAPVSELIINGKRADPAVVAELQGTTRRRSAVGHAIVQGLDRCVDWFARKGDLLDKKLAGEGVVARKARQIEDTKLAAFFARLMLSEAEAVTYRAKVEVRRADGSTDVRDVALRDKSATVALSRVSLGIVAAQAQPFGFPGFCQAVACLAGATLAVCGAVNSALGRRELAHALYAMTQKHLALGLAIVPGMVLPPVGFILCAKVGIQDAQRIRTLNGEAPTIGDMNALAASA